MTQNFVNGLVFGGQAELYDANTDRTAFINPGGGVLAADGTTRLAGAMWQGSTLDTNFWTVYNTGTSSVASLTNSIVTLSSGVSNNGKGNIISVRHGRFLFINPNRWRGFIRLTATTASGCTRHFGAVDFTQSNQTLNNGFYFSIDGAGVVSCCTKLSTGSEIPISSGFNGNLGSTYSIPNVNFHAFEIVYYIAGAWFFIDGTLLHKITPTTEIMSDDMQLHCFAQSLNSASGTTSGTLEIGAMSILRHGKEKSRPNFSNITTNTTILLKRGSGTIHAITINKKPTTAGFLTLYDSLTAASPMIATIDINSSLGSEFDFGSDGLDFQFGLTAVTTANAGTPDLTIIYD